MLIIDAAHLERSRCCGAGARKALARMIVRRGISTTNSSPPNDRAGHGSGSWSPSGATAADFVADQVPKPSLTDLKWSMSMTPSTWCKRPVLWRRSAHPIQARAWGVGRRQFAQCLGLSSKDLRFQQASEGVTLSNRAGPEVVIDPAARWTAGAAHQRRGACGRINSMTPPRGQRRREGCAQRLPSGVSISLAANCLVRNTRSDAGRTRREAAVEGGPRRGLRGDGLAFKPGACQPALLLPSSPTGGRWPRWPAAPTAQCGHERDVHVTVTEARQLGKMVYDLRHAPSLTAPVGLLRANPAITPNNCSSS